MNARLFLNACLLAGVVVATGCSYRYSKMAILPDELEEASGLYVENEETYWLNNDSGGKPTLYAVNPEGELVDSLPIPGTSNIDWEDLSYDRANCLYIFDIGNNANKRRNLRVFRWNRNGERVDTIGFHYPDQEAFPPPPAEMGFDAEAAFWYADTLYIFSKDFLPNERYQTSLYAIPAQAGQHVAKLKSRKRLNKRVVTAAAISPSGKRIALLSYLYRPRKIVPKSRGSVFLLENYEGTDFLNGSIRKLDIPKVGIGRQFEALDFQDERTIIIAAEQTKINKPRLFRVKIHR